MLQSLYVKNLALIDEIEVEFGEGLNILTGETGAGKSIILGSINLALGARYTKEIVRKNTNYGLVELTFLLENRNQINKLEQMDIFPEEGVLVLSRRLMEGRSACKVNGETVSTSALREIAAVLIDIHGQHEHQSLLYPKHQLEILDAFAKEYIKEMQVQVSDAYKTYQLSRLEWDKANTDETERAKECAFLEFEISEIQKARLIPGEDEELEARYRRILNGKKITERIWEAYEHTANDKNNNASDALSRAIRCLSELASFDISLEGFLNQLTDIDNLLNDFNRELSDYSKSCEFSEEEFNETEERLNEINRLKTKYGNTIEDIIAYAEEKEQRLAVLKNYENYLAKLYKQYVKAKQTLYELAEALSVIRKEQGALLETEIKEGLAELNFSDTNFEIAFKEMEEAGADGKDEVCFLISLNPGEPIKPLADVASGGELSRIMLAIKTVLADRDDIETLIFDEIDVGISGRTAQKVSEKMELIGKRHQVICITHLAQIAAMADVHFAIEKNIEEGHTKTTIERLSKEASINELARILGGAQITDKVVENAREMKQLAKSTK